MDVSIFRCPECERYFVDASWYVVELESDIERARGCGAAYRACGMTSIIEQPHTPDRITVIIVGEELGF